MSKKDYVSINISGRIFTAMKSTIVPHRDTLLAMIFLDPESMYNDQVPYFDRSIEAFEGIWDYYRTGYVIKPDHVPRLVWDAEVDFWLLPKVEPQPDTRELLSDLIILMREVLATLKK